MAFVFSPASSFTSATRVHAPAVHSLRPARALVSRSRRAHIARAPIMSVSVGSPAVDFALPITGGSTLTLAGLFQTAKTVILYFYPRDATSGCTVEAQDFRDLLPEIRALDATVVGVSRDSVESHNDFSKDLNLNFPLISDDGTLTEGYGVWKLKKLGEKELMAVERSTFILQDGKVIKEWRGVKSGGHAGDVFEELKKLCA